MNQPTSKGKLYQGHVPDPDSPAGHRFDWSAIGVPHPDSPSGHLFDWPSIGAWHPHSPAGRHFRVAQRAHRSFSGDAKATLLWILDQLPLKQNAPYSIALLRHYAEGTGTPYDLGTVPNEWQDWIVRVTKRKPGRHPDLNPYTSELYDLRNSLDQFAVNVTEDGRRVSSTRIYNIEDVYQFNSLKSDKNQRGLNGFQLGHLSDHTSKLLRSLLPSKERPHSGGVTQGWKIRTEGKENILFIPQDVLGSLGKPFQVTGKFKR